MLSLKAFSLTSLQALYQIMVVMNTLKGKLHHNYVLKFECYLFKSFGYLLYRRLNHVKADVIDLDTNAKYEEFMSA